jgi:rubredoxin
MRFELADHPKTKVIFCYFEYDPKTLEAFKKSYPQAKWSRLKSAWVLPDTVLYRKRLNIPLPELGDQILPAIFDVNQRIYQI